MPADPRGRWFRVYSRQVLQHPKFKDLSHAELGAWLDLRSAVDLLDGEPMADRTEAVLRLRRRTKNPTRLIDRLIAVRLVDELPNGSLAIHDLGDHDKRTPSDEPEAIRARVTKHRAKKGNDVTDAEGNDVTSTPTRARGEAEQNRGDEEADAEADPVLPGLPADDDPLTIICQLLMSTAPIEDKEYRTKVDEQVRRYGKEWVTAAYRQAHHDLVESGDRPKRWDMKRGAEVHLAGWARAEELRLVEEQRLLEEAEANREPVEQTPEERERQTLMRKAIGIWIRGGRKGKVPESVDELRTWIDANQGSVAA